MKTGFTIKWEFTQKWDIKRINQIVCVCENPRETLGDSGKTSCFEVYTYMFWGV
jgi:hypothetical protein